MTVIIIPTEPEVFKPVTYPTVKKDKYLISNYGILYDRKRDIDVPSRPDKDGYSKLCVAAHSNEVKQVYVGIHQLVAWEFVSGFDIKSGRTIVNHKDTNKSNNYFLNLEWSTVAENTQHGYEHGNGKRGTEHYKNKYDIETIHLICKHIEGGLRNMEISNLLYGHNSKAESVKSGIYDLIRDIRRKKCWEHISRKYNF
ncbi:hypothetical protein D1872_242370 [compost metagenome]